MRKRKEEEKRTATGRRTAFGQSVRFAAAGILLSLLLAAFLPSQARAKGLDGLRKLNESGPDAPVEQAPSQDAAETSADSAKPGQQEQGQDAAETSDRSAELERQKGYLREALDRLRTLGITPDVVLADVQELIHHTGAESEEDAGDSAQAGSTDSTAADTSGIADVSEESAGYGQTEPPAGDSPADGIRAAGSSLQQSITEAGENAKSAADQKIGEAAESVKKTAQEKAKEAVGAFFDNLFAKIRELLPF